MWRREADQALRTTVCPKRRHCHLVFCCAGGNAPGKGSWPTRSAIEGPSLVRLIDLLQAEGLVERREDPPTGVPNATSHRHRRDKGRRDHRVLRRVRAYLLKDLSSEDLA